MCCYSNSLISVIIYCYWDELLLSNVQRTERKYADVKTSQLENSLTKRFSLIVSAILSCQLTFSANIYEDFRLSSYLTQI